MRGMPIAQLDFEGAYLQGKADCEIFMDLPKECYELGCGIPPNKVARLVKSIYGLHQSGNIWWGTLSKVLRNNGFIPTDAESCLVKRLIRVEF